MFYSPVGLNSSLYHITGIHNIIMVFTALVTENKLLLLSSSYTHLTLTAQALLALLYPLTFRYVLQCIFCQDIIQAVIFFGESIGEFT